jgi:hypothetical protein
MKKRAVGVPASDDRTMNAALSTETVDNPVHSISANGAEPLSLTARMSEINGRMRLFGAPFPPPQ